MRNRVSNLSVSRCQKFLSRCSIRTNMTKLFRGAILGAPGSGKGTLASKIIHKYDVYHLSTGDIFRKNIERGTDLGRRVQRYMVEGKLVPDVLVTKIALNAVKEMKDRNWLLDGFPRTLAQAEKLFMCYPLDLVISLKIPFEVIIERVKSRWIHPGSGRVYNTVYKPPKEPGRDDVTGEPLIQRPDDSPEAVLKRLEEYADFTQPLTDFFRQQRILKEFEGNTSDEIWKLVDVTLLDYLKPKS